MDYKRLHSAWLRVRDELLAERTADGHWVGELSSSALSTATAVSALSVVQSEGIADCGFQIADLVERGVSWLVRHQNDDGGFGDTDKSYSNIATTYLVVAALHLAGKAEEYRELLARAEKYIHSKRGIEGLKERYGIDKTFVVPIMTNLALAGLVKWEEISPLPFELAVVPQRFYRFVGMPVVSYAIPALVAIGQAHYHHKKPWNPITRLVRWLSITRSLKVLRRMQPESGGYLEATPLTSFVVMSLASMAVQSPKSKVQTRIAEEVIREGVRFLANSVRPDGSWPIDTNLATWVTTLSINALAAGGEDVAALLGPKCLDWLLSCQHTKRHPFTGADPGGWGWSNLSGAVPDSDDTAGAILALGAWRKSQGCSKKQFLRILDAMFAGGNWLRNIRNDDGGWPTFCRGWGRLPFDRSGTDLSAHAARSMIALQELFKLGDKEIDARFFDRYDFNLYRRFNGLPSRTREKYLYGQQRRDGSWVPLWFGNQENVAEENAVYGTAKVLMLWRDDGVSALEPVPEGAWWQERDVASARRGLEWLRENQNADGGWGSGVWNKTVPPSDEPQVRRGSPDPAETDDRRSPEAPIFTRSAREGAGGQFAIENCQLPIANSAANPQSSHSPLTTHHLPLTSSVEETALAVEALLPVADREEYRDAVEKGLEWLVTAVERGDHRHAAPIGFYFAKLWYYEKLYPIIFTASALGRACQQMRPANS